MKSTLNFCLTFLFLFCSFIGWSQNPHLDYKHAIKISNLSSFEKQQRTNTYGDTSQYYIFTDKTLKILQPTIAFQWRTMKNNIHEIELSNLVIDKEVSTTELVYDSTNTYHMVGRATLTRTAVAMRYEYIWIFNKTKERKLVPSLGFGVSPYFTHNNYSSTRSSSFPSSATYVGARAFVTPRLTYFLSNRLFIDLNLPMAVLGVHLLSETSGDPSLTEQERKMSRLDFQAFPPYFSGRIGIGIKL